MTQVSFPGSLLFLDWQGRDHITGTCVPRLTWRTYIHVTMMEQLLSILGSQSDGEVTKVFSYIHLNAPIEILT